MPRYTIVCLYEQANEQALEQANEQADEQANAYANAHNKLNITKLFNYLLNKKEKSEKFCEDELDINPDDKTCIIRILKKLDLYIENENTVELMTAKELLKYQICYYAIAVIFKNSYKVYLNKLTKEMLINKYLKAEEYCKNKSEDDVTRYLIKSLQNELEGIKHDN